MFMNMVSIFKKLLLFYPLNSFLFFLISSMAGRFCCGCGVAKVYCRRLIVFRSDSCSYGNSAIREILARESAFLEFGFAVNIRVSIKGK